MAMEDPIGNDSEKQELIWKFREMCDTHAGWTCFYEVQRNSLHLYLDLGLSLLKIAVETGVLQRDRRLCRQQFQDRDSIRGKSV